MQFVDKYLILFQLTNFFQEIDNSFEPQRFWFLTDKAQAMEDYDHES